MERKGEKEEGMGRRKSVERGEVMWNRKKGRREEGKGKGEREDCSSEDEGRERVLEIPSLFFSMVVQPLGPEIS